MKAHALHMHNPVCFYMLTILCNQSCVLLHVSKGTKDMSWPLGAAIIEVSEQLAQSFHRTGVSLPRNSSLTLLHVIFICFSRCSAPPLKCSPAKAWAVLCSTSEVLTCQGMGNKMTSYVIAFSGLVPSSEMCN